MQNVYQKSLELHEKLGGKLETGLKCKLETREDLSLAYTPGVAEVSREIAKDPKNLYKYTIKKNTVAVITDGTAVLGLGNVGPAAALPVMEGKCALFKKFGGVDAYPICIDERDPKKFIEIVKKISTGFGGINLEDIAAPHCFEIERTLIKELDIPVFHDDQHGTAIVVLAGLINALKVSDKKIGDVKIVICGAGAAGLAIAELLHFYGAKHILIVDTKGIIYEGREHMDEEKTRLAQITNPKKVYGNFTDALYGANVFIGVSKAGILTKEMIKTMDVDPIIFAMANPEPEIMPEDAKAAGAFIVATGRSDCDNQINNVVAFPGIFRGALDKGIKKFNLEMFVETSKALAECVLNPTRDKIIPEPFDEKAHEAVAKAI
ncbi:MAG: malic enzyme, malate dehydrogenase (oxaloacetate-decarboxylating) [Candidatus Peregrinibacteria bacterium GW2011_GWC2_39_14]|nr:MAG: Malate dehydrogenase (Oxaloacetate-decarboxylating) [Candidatus Peregrinibacteria bacterium GW2011_GWA2_38_36]KKR06623.1 MAG: malic enzyme, malate dehydrogenase (oxaloacetate-decarboxylating) [Candidatus Peregrinibacteria bacterium GW2011_GWC2_39_14]